MMLRNRAWLTGVLLVVLGLLGGCSLFNREQDVVQRSPLPVVTNQLTLSRHWKRTIGRGVGSFYSRLQPAYHEDHIYVADRQGKVAALDAASGQPIWQVTIASTAKRSALLASGITVAGDRLLLGSENAEVIALNAADGKLLWRSNVAGEVVATPISHQQLVLVHTSNGVLQALNHSDGKTRWRLNLDIPILSLRGESKPTISAHDGIVVVGGKNGRVSAISLEQGALIWQQQIAKPTGATEIDRLNDVAATPVVVDGQVLALSYHGSLSALALHTGEIIWQRKFSSATDFLVYGHHLYLVDQADSVVAIDIRSGTELWRQCGLQHHQLTALTHYRDALVVGDAQGYLHWLAVADGHFMAQQKIDKSGFYTAPVVAAEQLLLQARNGTIYAVTHAASH